MKVDWQRGQKEQITGYLLTQCLQNASIVLFLQESCEFQAEKEPLCVDVNTLHRLCT